MASLQTVLQVFQLLNVKALTFAPESIYFSVPTTRNGKLSGIQLSVITVHWLSPLDRSDTHHKVEPSKTGFCRFSLLQ